MFCLPPLDDLGAQGLKSLQRWEGEPQQGQNSLPEVVREPVGDAGDRRLIAPPTSSRGLKFKLASVPKGDPTAAPSATSSEAITGTLFISSVTLSFSTVSMRDR